MRLYVARHGQTIANRDHIISGHFDTPLSDLGIKQASKLGKALANKNFDKIFSSDLVRAKKTGEALHAYHSDIPFSTSSQLRERFFGVRERLPFEEVYVALNLDPETSWSGDMKDEKGYESNDQYVKRVTEFFESEIFPLKDTDKTLLITCHKGTCNVIAGLLRGDAHQFLQTKENRIGFKNTAYSIYEINLDGVAIVEENIFDHLD